MITLYLCQGKIQWKLYSNHRLSCSRYRHFGSTFNNTKVKLTPLPKFDTETFFNQLKLHNARLQEQKETKIEWKHLLEVQLKQTDSHLLNHQEELLLQDTRCMKEVAQPVTKNANKSFQNSFSYSKDLSDHTFSQDTNVREKKGLDNSPPDWFISSAASLEISDLLQRISDLLVRANDFHASVWKRTVEDLIELHSRLTEKQLTCALDSLSYVRCPNSHKLFSRCETHIMNRIKLFQVSEVITILAAYARMEMLWGVISEDAELKLIKHSGLDYLFSYPCNPYPDSSQNIDREINSSPPSDVFGSQDPSPFDDKSQLARFSQKTFSRLHQSCSTPPLREYYPDTLMETAASTSGIGRFMGSKFLNAVLPLCYEAVRSQSLGISNCIMLLFALTAQRPKLLEGSLVIWRKNKPSSSISHVSHDQINDETKQVSEFVEKRLRRFGCLISGVAYELMRQLNEHNLLTDCDTKVQSESQTLCLGIFLLGRLKTSHDNVLQGFKLSIANGNIRPEDLSSRLEFLFKRQNDLSSFHSMSSKVQCPISSLSHQQQSLITQLASKLYYSKLLEPAALVLLLSGMHLLGLQNCLISTFMQSDLESSFHRSNPNDLIGVLVTIRILRYFESSWTLPFLQLAVNRNDDLNRHQKAEFEQTVYTALWWMEQQTFGTNDNKIHQLYEFCNTLKQQRLIRRRSSHQASFEHGNNITSKRFPEMA